MTARVLVSTFQRGGSSLVMQMLFAAGLPCLGRWPAFEDDRASGPGHAGLIVDADWIAACHGNAIKILDPHRWESSAGPVANAAIWLDRAPAQRAKSAIKFLRALAPEAGAARRHRGALAASYVEDRPKALAALSALSIQPVLMIRFEHLISRPVEAARSIAEYVGIPEKAPVMAREVRHRSVGVYRGFIEAELLAEARP